MIHLLALGKVNRVEALAEFLEALRREFQNHVAELDVNRAAIFAEKNRAMLSLKHADSVLMHRGLLSKLGLRFNAKFLADLRAPLLDAFVCQVVLIFKIEHEPPELLVVGKPF